MKIEARENAKDNDLFYLCGLIDYIARKTKNTRSDVVDKLGKERLEKIYDLADIYHSDNQYQEKNTSHLLLFYFSQIYEYLPNDAILLSQINIVILHIHGCSVFIE